MAQKVIKSDLQVIKKALQVIKMALQVIKMDRKVTSTRVFRPKMRVFGRGRGGEIDVS